MDKHPAFLLGLLVGIEFAGQVPEMLAGVIKIDNLNGPGEVLIGDIPDPFGSIADDDLLYGTAPAALPGFQIDALAELLGGLNSSDVGSRIGIADREALVIPGRLGEHASQLDFPRVGRLPLYLALAAEGFLLHYGDSSAVHLHMQNRDWFTDDQIGRAHV